MTFSPSFSSNATASDVTDSYIAESVSSTSLASWDAHKLAQLAVVVDECIDHGVHFDQFYQDYIHPEGKCLSQNPFFYEGEPYTPAELYMQLRKNGYGLVPEAAVNVFWQTREKLKGLLG